MSLIVKATITCVDCWRSITFEARDTRASDVIDVARHDYGWVTTKDKERCFDDRARPIPFHPIDPGHGAGSFRQCVTCKAYDDTDRPRHAAHRQALVEKRAAELRREHYVNWNRG